MEKIKNLLPLGYLYLIILGILKESILYNQLDINILKYSSIMDIMISPIADIATNPILMIIILIVLIVSILAQHYCTNERYKPLILKTFAKDVDSSATNEEIKINVQQKLLKVLAIGLLVFFVGIGAGAGAAKVKRIEEGNLKYYYTLNLISGEEHDIYLIGWNTSYYFYARKGDNKIYISPVTSVKTLAIKDDRDVK